MPENTSDPVETIIQDAWDRENLHALAKIARSLARQLRDAREDAGRWRHSIEHGFPVRNQTASHNAVQWIAFVLGTSTPFTGKSPNTAIDAAIDAATLPATNAAPQSKLGVGDGHDATSQADSTAGAAPSYNAEKGKP